MVKLLALLPLVISAVAAAGNASVESDCPLVCPMNYAPVCGSDGVTYGNACSLAAAKCKNPALTQVSDGECPTKPTCEIACTKEYNPVCGSDGVTYGNACMLKVAKCKNPALTQVSTGPCPTKPVTTKPTCEIACTKEYNPVCGSDGVTYGNPCMLKVAICKNPALTQVSTGPCPTKPVTTTAAPTKCPEMCTMEYNPQCGTDGVTYGNPCMLKVAICKNPKLKLAYAGECTTKATTKCPIVACTMVYAPVCGSDSVTYSNLCMLNAAKCNNPTLTKVADGECLPLP